jgi:hypothetical protein
MAATIGRNSLISRSFLLPKIRFSRPATMVTLFKLQRFSCASISIQEFDHESYMDCHCGIRWMQVAYTDSAVQRDEDKQAAGSEVKDGSQTVL